MNYISSYGIGDLTSSAVHPIIRRLISDEVLIEYTWKGTVQKSSFENHSINSVIFRAINMKFNNFTMMDYEKSAKSWIRHTYERIKRNNK